MKRIAIIDYGAGNIFSVAVAVRKFDADAFLTRDPSVLKNVSRIILPGVGAFGDGMENLLKTGMAGALKEEIAAGKEFLGICLGFQMLFSWSEEGDCAGLGVMRGRVVRFRPPDPSLPVPHMGWNRVGYTGSPPPVARGIPDDSWFYFAHSYHVVPEDPAVIAGRTDYGGRFVSFVRTGNVTGVQFHPEKSGSFGLRFIRQFVEGE